MIHFSIAMCRISVDIKAERRGRGQLHYLADASPPRPPTLTGGGRGSTDSVLIVDNYIMVFGLTYEYIAAW